MKTEADKVKIERRINSEARLCVIEEQLNQNVKDHQIVLSRIDHNCELQQERFDKIEALLLESLETTAKIVWVEWFAKGLIIAFVTAIIGLVVWLLQRHL